MPPVERYAGTPFVVAGEQKATIDAGTQSEDTWRSSSAHGSTPRSCRGSPRSPASRRHRRHPRRRPSCTARTGDRGPRRPSRPRSIRGRALRSRPTRCGPAMRPATADDLVVDAGLARRGGLHVGDRVRLASNGPARSMIVAGIARTPVSVERQGVLFVTRRCGAAGRHAGPRRRHRRASRAPAADRGALRDRLQAAVAAGPRRHRRHARRGRAPRGHRGPRGGDRHRRNVRRSRAADRDVRREQHDRPRDRPARARDRAAARRRRHPAAGAASGRSRDAAGRARRFATSASCPAPRSPACSATRSPTTASRPRT